MSYVLATNTLIYFFKGLSNVAERLLTTSPADIAIPSIVIFELETGIAKSSQPEKRRQQLDALLSQTNIMAFGIEEARIAARIRADLESNGQQIGPCDVLIAASAISYGGTLITHNQKEFSRVNGLLIDDWY